MNTAIGLYTLIGILLAGGIAGHFNSHPSDWNVLVRGVRCRLSEIKEWLYHGDWEEVFAVVMPCAIIIVIAASWLRWELL